MEAGPLNIVGSSSSKLGSGCYLVFETHSEGVFFLHWSATPVPEACMFFSPSKTVPKFKFVTNGGRSELIRSFRGPNRSRFFEGVCQFVRLAKEMEASQLVLLTDSFQVFCRMAEGQVLCVSVVVVVLVRCLSSHYAATLHNILLLLYTCSIDLPVYRRLIQLTLHVAFYNLFGNM